MTDPRPALLIDVDGPLNAYQITHGAPGWPERYRLHYVQSVGFDRTLRLWLNQGHGPMLLSLADEMELMWCTAWGADANTHIGPRIGLPALPVLDVGEPRWSANRIWKRPSVEDAMKARPFAWYDDDFTSHDHRWAAARTTGGRPSLLVDVSPRTGLTEDHIEAVRDWSATLTRTASATEA